MKVISRTVNSQEHWRKRYFKRNYFLWGWM